MSDPRVQLQAILDAMPTAIEPTYLAAEDGRSIWLYRGPGEWQSEAARTHVGDAFIYLDLVPSFRLYIEAKVPAGVALGDWLSSRHSFELPTLARPPVPPHEQLGPLQEQEGTVQQLGPNAGINVGSRRMTKYVDFAVLNYPELTGRPIRYPNGSATARVQFAGAGWKVTLDPVADSSGVWERLAKNGGVAVTHGGRLERVGGELFAPSAAMEILECLHYFLWFTKGRSCALCLPVGFDRSGQRLWAQWRALWVAPEAAALSWVDKHEGANQLAQLFPLFEALWRDPTYHSALRISLRYYLDANDANPLQRGVALAQLCLEAIAYAHLVTAGHDPTAFGRRVHANVTLRTLLKLLRVPTAIPRSMSALHSVRPASWTMDPWDGPSAVTWLRNDVLHGEKKVPPPTLRAWTQAWRLSGWYVELCLLSLCGYQGSYRSRVHEDTWVGSTRPVPWAPRPPRR